MKRKIKEFDRVIVPAWVDGFGEDRLGRVMDVSRFMGVTLVTVRYDYPDPNGRMGTVVYEHQLIKISALCKHTTQIPKTKKYQKPELQTN